MRILMLGGTSFLGRHTVEAALERGHEVTIFHRGQHNPDLFPQVEKLLGDRDGDLAPLVGRQWDAVIDTSGFVPRIVRKSASLLADAAAHYTFVSSISAYADPVNAGTDETAPLATTDDETTEDVMTAYGALKVLCEQTVDSFFPGRALHIRAGLIIGPYDYTDRFPYWLHRVAMGGEVLAPGRPDRRVQAIDARDIAAWNVSMIEGSKAGVYNVTGPDYPLTMGDILAACRSATASDAAFTWVDEDFLLDNGVAPWSDLPFWLPEAFNGMLDVSIDKAVRDGLSFRPIEATARDVHEWNQSRDLSRAGWSRARDNDPMQVGIEPARERALLERWHARQGA